MLLAAANATHGGPLAAPFPPWQTDRSPGPNAGSSCCRADRDWDRVDDGVDDRVNLFGFKFLGGWLHFMNLLDMSS